MKKRDQVRETRVQLVELAKRLTGRQVRPIRMLLAMLDDPLMSLRKVARKSEMVERAALHKWRLYLQEGIGALTHAAGVYLLTSRPSYWRVPGPYGWDKFFAEMSNGAASEVHWMDMLQDNLFRLANDVDWALVAVHFKNDRSGRDGYSSSDVVYPHLTTEEASLPPASLSNDHQPSGSSRSSCVLQEGDAVDGHHRSVQLDYYSGDDCICTIWLFREVGRTAISQETTKLLFGAAAGIIELFTTCIPRLHDRTADRNGMEPTSPASYGLTPREAQVLYHYQTGASVGDISTILAVSPHAIRKHMRSIHIKTRPSP